MAAHTPTDITVIQPVLPDQPQSAWAPWLREIAARVNEIGAKTTDLAAGGGGGTGPAGPPGPTGATGPAGPTGATGATGPAGSANMSGMVAGQIPIAATATSVTSSTAALAAGFMPAYTGDVTSPAGSTVNTLPTVNSNVGTWNNITVNGKGLVTAASNQSYLTSSGVSGMTSGQIPLAASATTITSSGNLSGAVTTSGSLVTTLAANAVATTNIINANVTYAKIQNVAAARLLGNPTGSAASPAEISLGTNLTFAGTVLNGLATPVTVANGGTNKTSWTTGSVAFAASTAALGEDNANFIWDNTGKKLLVNGGVSIGTGGAAGHYLDVAGAGLAGVGDYVCVVRNSHVTAGDNCMYVGAGPNAADTTSSLFTFVDGGVSAVMGAIKRNGAAAVAYNTTSDIRLKENLSDSDVGLEALMQLRVRDFNFKREDRRQQGLIAQELAEIYPVAVSQGGDDPIMEPWGIDYGRLTPLLIRAVQQLAARVAELEARLPA